MLPWPWSLDISYEVGGENATVEIMRTHLPFVDDFGVPCGGQPLILTVAVRVYERWRDPLDGFTPVAVTVRPTNDEPLVAT